MALIPQNGTTTNFPTRQYQTAEVGYIWLTLQLQNPDECLVIMELWNKKSDKFNPDGTLTSNAPISYQGAGSFICPFNDPDIGAKANNYVINYLQTNFNLNFVTTDI
jgi:hypothetical protein